MIKLSELKDDVIVVDENNRIYTVEEVRNDLKYFRDESKELYTTTEYHASVDAKSVIEETFEQVYCNGMYEDWDERIMDDITDEDVEKIQAVFDEILSRNEEQNITYYQNEEVEVDVWINQLKK